MTAGELIFCSSSQPIYCAPPGDGLFFGNSYPGDRLVFATRSQPVYIPPAGDAIFFGCRLADEPVADGASASGELWVGGSAVAKLVHAARATGLLDIYGAVSGQSVVPAGSSGNLAIFGQAHASTAIRLTLNGTIDLSGISHGVKALSVAAAGDMTLGGQAYYAPTWYTPVPFVGQVRSGWTKSQRRNLTITAGHRQAPVKDLVLNSPWGAQETIGPRISGSWNQIPKLECRTRSPWGDLAQHPQANVAADYSHPDSKQREALRLSWDSFQSVCGSFSLDYAHPDKKEVQRDIPWNDLDAINRHLQIDYSHPAVKDVFKPIISGPYWYPRWCVNRYDSPVGNALIFDADGWNTRLRWS